MVVLPESGWEIMARLRRRAISGRGAWWVVSVGGVEWRRWRRAWWWIVLMEGVGGVKAWVIAGVLLENRTDEKICTVTSATPTRI